MTTSLGVIETRGLTPAIQAADAACKSAAVNLVGYRKVGSGLVSVMFHGEISAVSAAVESGVEAAQDIVASLVIARPDNSVLAMLDNAACSQPPAPEEMLEVAAASQTTPESTKPVTEPVEDVEPTSDVTEVAATVSKEAEPQPEAHSQLKAKPVEEKPATSRKATGDKPAAKRSTRTRKQGPRK